MKLLIEPIDTGFTESLPFILPNLIGIILQSKALRLLLSLDLDNGMIFADINLERKKICPEDAIRRGAFLQNYMNVIGKQFHKVLAEQVYHKFFSKNKIIDCHVHFHIFHHKDHLILLCSGSQFGKVISKSPSCRKGESAPWLESSFSSFNRERILQELSLKISLIRIDCGGCDMSWTKLDDFLLWIKE